MGFACKSMTMGFVAEATGFYFDAHPFAIQTLLSGQQSYRLTLLTAYCQVSFGNQQTRMGQVEPHY
jgi:hypothetical protein